MSLQAKSNKQCFKISDALRHKLNVNYKFVTESIDCSFTLSDGFNCFMNKASLIFRLKVVISN